MIILAALVVSVTPALVALDGDAAPVPDQTTMSTGDQQASTIFGASAPWKAPIPANPVLEKAGPSIARYLADHRHPAVANLYEHGVPIWNADASTPRYDVQCTQRWEATCGLERQPVPVPDEAFATRVTDDGAMVVVDWSTRTSYEFFQGSKAGAQWQAGWGSVVSIDSDGSGGATGSSISRLAGVVRASEIASGFIDHALVFSTNNACTERYRYPATKTDGVSTRADCIPEGTRIQLDPTIDVSTISGITLAERAVARALQTYGAYAIDNGGANMAFIFEVPSGEADPYPAAGLAWDYYAMDRIPWDKLRVLDKWNGT